MKAGEITVIGAGTHTGRCKAVDYMLAYSTGPEKLGHIPSVDLHAARLRWQQFARSTNLFSLEVAYRNRIDEEGCGAVFGALSSPVTWASDMVSLGVTGTSANPLIMDEF
jgi:hypothetical protein